VQQLAYGWDEAGNLTTRQDLNQGLTETFIYDALERLTSASGPGGTLTVSYDAIGNITSRSDVGSYTYHATKRHAVTAAGSNTYSYDANGNLKTRNGKSLTWRSYNLPSLINGVGYSASFSYTPDRQRWRQVSGYASGNETTIYVGTLLEKLSTPVRKHWKHRIPTPSGEVQVIRRSDGTTETLYFANDHLGSVDAVLNGSGTVLARPSFNAWGGRRGSNWQGSPSQPEWQAIADTTRRGYTGHEQLDNVMLVHMNGRVYDPAIGRFLSADPYVDGETDPQGWNRYGYVQNRPLRLVDPSGYSSSSIRGFSLGMRIAWINRDSKYGTLNPVVIGTSQELVIQPDGTEEWTMGYTTIWPSWQTELADWFRSARLERTGGAEPDGGGGASGTPRQEEPQREPPTSRLCEAGNLAAEWANTIGNVSGKLELAGLGVAGLGFVTAQPQVTAPGLALAATGGIGNIGSGLMQFGAGLLQGAGGGGFSNSGYAALSLATGFVLARGITGPPVSGYRTVSQRASDAFRNGTATVAGGVNGAWTSLIDAAAPRQVSCPGGN
jgi:RHS repeat-associated protein